MLPDLKYFQTVEGETIAYREIKNEGKPKILLIHGNMSSSVHFDLLMDHYKLNYHLIAIDLRGFGSSSYLHRFDSLYELSNDVKQVVEHLHLDSFYVLGWSTGGGVALELAATMGTMVQGVILVSSVGVTGYRMYLKDAMGQPINDQYVLTRAQIVADPIQVQPILQAYQSQQSGLLKIIWDSLIYNLHHPDEKRYELYLSEMLKQRNLIDIDYSLIYFNMSDYKSPATHGSGRWKLITAPILILHGEQDLVVSPEDSRQTKALFGNQARLELLEHCGHSPFTDDLALIANTIDQFIGETNGN